MPGGGGRASKILLCRSANGTVTLKCERNVPPPPGDVAQMDTAHPQKHPPKVPPPPDLAQMDAPPLWTDKDVQKIISDRYSIEQQGTVIFVLVCKFILKGKYFLINIIFKSKCFG